MATKKMEKEEDITEELTTKILKTIHENRQVHSVHPNFKKCHQENFKASKF